MEEDVRDDTSCVYDAQLRDIRSKLGGFHNLKDKRVFVADLKEALPSLRDLQILLNRKDARLVPQRLGEWNFGENFLVPLFLAYREDSSELVLVVLAILACLTKPVDKTKLMDECADSKVGLDLEISIALNYLQDYKEACVRPEFFRVLVSEWMKVIPEDVSCCLLLEDTPESKLRYTVILLLRNLVNIPDPMPGDRGWSQNRQSMQINCVRYFRNEDVFPVLAIFAEKVGMSTEGAEIQNDEEMVTLAWLLHSIVVKVCAVVDPGSLVILDQKVNEKGITDLLRVLNMGQRQIRPNASRRAFGSSFEVRSFLNDPSLKYEQEQRLKARTPVEKRFKNRQQRGKEDLTRDKLFVDLQAGSVTQHNLQNSFMKGTTTVERLDTATLKDLKQFYTDFIQLNAVNSIIHHLMREMRQNSGPLQMGQERDERFCGHMKFDFLNFTSWFIEYIRYEFLQNKRNAPEKAELLDINVWRELINIETISFVADVISAEGKVEKINASTLIIALRCSVHQMRMTHLVCSSPVTELQYIGEVLTEDLVQRIPFELCWIIKNFKPTTHDPRVLTYLVDGIHHCFRLMAEMKKEDKFKVQVDRRGRTKMMGISDFVNELSEGRIIDNLFMLLESPMSSRQILGSVCGVIGRIIQLRPTNVCIFFQISFFARMEKIINRGRKDCRKYQDVLRLLQYILGRFFQLSRMNAFLCVELLYPKLKARKDSLVSNEEEWEGMMQNYNTIFFERKFEDFKNGATYKKMLEESKGGKPFIPWSNEEDEVLKQNFEVLRDTPDFLARLIALLPDTKHVRLEDGVHNRLIELGFLKPKKKPLTLEEAMAKYMIAYGEEAREALDKLASKLEALLPQVPVEVADVVDDLMFKKIMTCLKARKVRDQHAWRLADPAYELRDTFNRIRLLDDTALRELLPQGEAEDEPQETYAEEEELDAEELRHVAGLRPEAKDQTGGIEADDLLEQLFGELDPGMDDAPAFPESEPTPQQERVQEVNVKAEPTPQQERVQEVNVKAEPTPQQKRKRADVDDRLPKPAVNIKMEPTPQQKRKLVDVDDRSSKRPTATSENVPEAEHVPDELERQLEAFMDEFDFGDDEMNFSI